MYEPLLNSKNRVHAPAFRDVFRNSKVGGLLVPAVLSKSKMWKAVEV